MRLISFLSIFIFFSAYGGDKPLKSCLEITQDVLTKDILAQTEDEIPTEIIDLNEFSRNSKSKKRAHTPRELKAIKIEKTATYDLNVLRKKERLINWALTLIKDKSEFLPSEIRELKKASDYLKEMEDFEDANKILRKISSQEARHEIKRKRAISVVDRAQLERKVYWSKASIKDFEALSPDVKLEIENLLLKVLKNPKDTEYRFPSGNEGYRAKLVYKSVHYRVVYTAGDGGTIQVKAVGSRESVYRTHDNRK